MKKALKRVGLVLLGVTIGLALADVGPAEASPAAPYTWSVTVSETGATIAVSYATDSPWYFDLTTVDKPKQDLGAGDGSTPVSIPAIKFPGYATPRVCAPLSLPIQLDVREGAPLLIDGMPNKGRRLHSTFVPPATFFTVVLPTPAGCHSPSPSPSPTITPTAPVPTHSTKAVPPTRKARVSTPKTTQAAVVTSSLPFTGAPTEILGLGAFALVSGGVGLFAAGRRGRGKRAH